MPVSDPPPVDIDPASIERVVAERLGLVDQRYTSGRRKLVASLMAAPRPETIPELLDRSPGLRQSSAYRNLHVLEQVGVVHRIVTSGEHARFELAEDLVGHHHHLICTECGRVDDFTVPAKLERTLESALAKAVFGTGFQSTSHRLDLIGTCEGCQA
jgi:Fe2+ or Zn2+ uptake regulation protein